MCLEKLPEAPYSRASGFLLPKNHIIKIFITSETLCQWANSYLEEVQTVLYRTAIIYYT